jgi:hypothetical protein
LGFNRLCDGNWGNYLITVDKSIVGPWIAEQCNMVWTPENSTTIGLEKNGELVAGVWYEDFNGKSVTAPVMSSNEKSIGLVSNMGFEKEAQLLDVFPDGDLLFFVLTKDKCRFLGESNG